MILAAGLGTRLGAITRDLPKALVPVAGRAMLDHVVDKLKTAGVDQLMINLHFRGQMIRDHVAAQKSYGITVEFSEEPQILGTGGGLKNAEKFFAAESAFFVHNCDVYSDVDFPKLLAVHRASRAIGTIVVLKGKQSSYLVFDGDKKLIGWEMADGSSKDFAREDGGAKQYCYTGIRVFSPKIFDYMRADTGSFPIVRTYVKAARDGQIIRAYPIENNFWIDMGTPDKLKELERKLTVTM